jgi:hypothetical protein
MYAANDKRNGAIQENRKYFRRNVHKIANIFAKSADNRQYLRRNVQKIDNISAKPQKNRRNLKL